MEINLNKEQSTEISIFINFSIRNYVAEIRKKNPVKCWPFGSLRDPDDKVVSSCQSSESKLLSSQHCPTNINGSDDTTKATNLSKVENHIGKEDRPETTTDMLESLRVDSNIEKVVCNGSSELTFCKVNNGQNRHENNVNEGAKVRNNEAADNNESGRNKPRRKSNKSRLLSDIYKDPASELRAGCDITNPENVNKRFAAEGEDDSDDDVTLAAYFKRQKGVDITDLILNKKKDMIGVEEPSVDQDKKSNHGSKDSIGKDSNVVTSRKKRKTDDIDTQTTPEHKKDFRLQCSQKSNPSANISSKEATEKENEDSEMEAVMLLARHFNEQKQILRRLQTNTTRARAKKKIREPSIESGNKPVTKTSSKIATKHQVKNITNKRREKDFCSVEMMCFMPTKATLGGGFQSHVETSMMKPAGVGPDAQNCATLICSFNRNPADFSTPNGKSRFMRGC
ncbi:putative protein EMBRYONIC FLOWER 1 [Helianthus annuus]|nr:putative protein EMBRYONIC FLOWER 1 [Helianthus annuus]